MSKTNSGGAGRIVGKCFKWFFITLGTLLLVGALTGAIMACYAANYIRDVILPQVEDSSMDPLVGETDLSSNIYYYDEAAGEYQTLQTLYATENRVWVSYEDIPDDLINATVAIEDKRFWTHSGVDWKRTAAAILYMFTGQQVQGGSTITQQLIKNLTGENDVTVKRKVLEIFEALDFDKKHSKEYTLEWYLNQIFLGRGCYGVVTAAEKYFGKTLDELSLAECASLISITNNPSLYDPYTRPEKNHTRAKTVILQMLEQEYISETEAKAALDELGMVEAGVDEDGNTIYEYHEELDKIEVALNTVDTNGGASSDSGYTWYTDAVIEQVIDDLQEKYGYEETVATNLLYAGGLQIYSCLDQNVQSVVDEVYENKSNFAEYTSAKGQDLISSITIVDNQTGAVVAMAGGVGEKTGKRGWNCATMTKRPSGSSIKPLSVYAPAIEEGLITPYTAVDDSPFRENEDGNGKSKLWPVNAEGYYRGLTTVRTGMVESLNTLAVKVLDMEGIETAYEYLTRRFGITSLVAADLDYAPLALGGQTWGVSTYEMAAAYSAFPRGGVYTSPYLYTVVTDSNGNIILATDGYDADVDGDGNVTITGTADTSTILSESTCYYITDMLRGVINESGGTGRAAAISGVDAAGKTGTTTNDYDRWFCGYTSNYTAAVWCGYDSQEKINSKSNPSTVLWQTVMSKLSAVQPPEDMTYEVETVKAQYCTASGGIPTDACKAAGTVATGTFVKGDEPTKACTVHTFVTLCTESGLLAGDKCLETEKVVALNYTRTGAAALATIKEKLETVASYQTAGICEGEEPEEPEEPAEPEVPEEPEQPQPGENGEGGSGGTGNGNTGSGGQEPSEPNTQEPSEPNTQEPTEPGTQEPSEPNTQEPAGGAPESGGEPAVSGEP